MRGHNVSSIKYNTLFDMNVRLGGESKYISVPRGVSDEIDRNSLNLASYKLLDNAFYGGSTALSLFKRKFGSDIFQLDT